nr:putative GMC-type oxidoreductase [Megavirus caiporensis]
MNNKYINNLFIIESINKPNYFIISIMNIYTSVFVSLFYINICIFFGAWYYISIGLLYLMVIYINNNATDENTKSKNIYAMIACIIAANVCLCLDIINNIFGCTTSYHSKCYMMLLQTLGFRVGEIYWSYYRNDGQVNQ